MATDNSFSSWWNWMLGDDSSKTLQQVSLSTSIMGALSNVVGSRNQTKARKQQLEHSAKMADINMRINQLDRESKLSARNRSVSALAMKAGQIKSQQRVAMAANGIDLTSANAQDVFNQTDVMKELDSQQIMINALNGIFGADFAKIEQQNKALQYRTAAKSISPVQTTLTTLLGGATTVANQWYLMDAARRGTYGMTTTYP